MAANPKTIGVVAVAIIVVANGWLIWRTLGRSNSSTRGEQAYFTVDDGATYFVDSTVNKPPFLYNGKQAYMAHVFVSKNGSKFVGYLQQMPEAGRKVLEEVKEGKASPMKLAGVPLVAVKKPGGTKWYTPRDGRAYMDVITVKDPNGGGTPLETFPGE